MTSEKVLEIINTLAMRHAEYYILKRKAKKYFQT